MLYQNNISNYLLSSGVKVFLEKVSISSYFKEILKKNGIDNEDCSNIIYIGDGFTDYYAMKYIKEHGGTSIFVYKNLDSKDMQSIKEKDVIDFYTKADFSQNSELYNYVKKICKIR